MIMTNRHVVEDAVQIRVSLADGRVLTGEIVGLDSSIDIAVLEVDADDLLVAATGDSGAIRVGDDVVVLSFLWSQHLVLLVLQVDLVVHITP